LRPAAGDLCLPTGDHDSTMGNYLDKNSRYKFAKN